MTLQIQKFSLHVLFNDIRNFVALGVFNKILNLKSLNVIKFELVGFWNYYSLKLVSYLNFRSGGTFLIKVFRDISSDSWKSSL